MGRLINETAVTTLVSGDKILVDNTTLGTRQINYSDLSTQMEIVARKGAANGYASLDSSGKVPAAQISSPYTIEAAANAAARDALTVTTPQIGVRQVRLTDTGVIYVPNAAGSGAGIWMVFNSVGVASTSAPGILQIADNTEAETDNTMALTIQEWLRRNAPYRTALAPAQGLGFNGVAGATIVLSAPGTGDFTVAARVVCADFSISRSILDSAANGFVLRVNTSGQVEVVKSGVGIQLTSTSTLTAGAVTSVAYVRASSVGTIYINGVAAGTGADASNYSVAALTIGAITNTVNSIVGFCAFNRALAVADILALYQTGAVARGDINTINNDSGTAIGAGQQIINGSNSTFATDTGWWTKSGTVIAAGVATMGTGNQLTRSSLLKIGSSYTLTFTVGAYVSGGAGHFLVQCSGATIIAPTSNGVKTVTFVATGTDLQFYSQTDTLTVDDVTLLPLGALIAPDANNAGAGLEWLDVSGNRAHIVLPTSGVSWNLPSSQQIAIEATTNTATNQQLGAASLIDVTKQWRIQSWTVNCSTGTPTISLGNASAGAQYVSALVLAAGNNDITLLTRFPATANLWCVSTTTATLIHRIVLVPAN